MPSLLAAALSILLALVGAAPALAADGEGTRLSLDEAPARATGEAGASGGGLVRTIVGLAIVIGVIYGITWVLRQVKRSKDATASGTGLATLATLPLGTGRALHLVRAGDEVVLLGAAESGVTPIRTYKRGEARALGLLEETPTAPAPPAPIGPGAPKATGSVLDKLRNRTVIK